MRIRIKNRNPMRKCLRTEFRNARAELRDVPSLYRWPDNFGSGFPAFNWPKTASEAIYKICWPLLLIIREPNPERIGLTWDEQGHGEFIISHLRLGFLDIVTNHPQLDQPWIHEVYKALEVGKLIEAADKLKLGLWSRDSVVRVACADILMRMKSPACQAMDSIEKIYDIYGVPN